MGQYVQGRWLGSAIDRRDPAEDVFLVGSGILDENVEIPAGAKRIADRIAQLEFRVLPAAPRDSSTSCA